MLSQNSESSETRVKDEPTPGQKPTLAERGGSCVTGALCSGITPRLTALWFGVRVAPISRMHTAGLDKSSPLL